jgi:hypothetical protein
MFLMLFFMVICENTFSVNNHLVLLMLNVLMMFAY